MSTVFQAIGPLTRVPYGGSYNIDNAVLCSDELGFIVSAVREFDDDGHVTSSTMRVFSVNPTTGTLISNHVYDMPLGFSQGYGQLQRLDDTTACFAVWDYGPSFRGGTGDLTFGRITSSNLTLYHHTPDFPDAEHFKDTGQSLYVDYDARVGSIMYYPVYHINFITGVGYVLDTTAQAVVFNFDTGASHEYEVTVNMGPLSDRSAYPQYYGTVPLPDGRVLSADLNGVVRDQDSAIIDTIDAEALGGYDFDSGWLYQLNGTTDLILIFELAVSFSRFPLYVQRYSTTGGFSKIGNPVQVAYSQDSSTNAEAIFVSGITDEMNPFQGGTRIANLPYFDNANRADSSQSFYIGSQSLQDGSRGLGQITVPYPNFNSFWYVTPTPASAIGDAGKTHILYTFNWQYPPDDSLDAVWFQLWSSASAGDALRLVQRDDGNGAQAHPRLTSSGARTKSSRVDVSNTYD